VPGTIALSLLYGTKEPQSYVASREAILRAGKKENEFAKIWSDKSIRFTFIAWCCASIALQFGYYGANTWLPSYLVRELGVDLKNAGWYIASTYGAMALSKAAAGYLGDRVGRRVVWFVSCAGAAVALPLIVHYATPVNVAFLLIFFGLLGGAPYGVNGAYMSESFPTAIRATALGTAYNIGRLGAMSAPLMIGYVSGVYSIAMGIALLGITYGICAVIPPLTIREMMYDPKGAVESSKVPQEA
jgi:AAHS family cis,cis-muconate transporter-like MFS transporter